MATRPASAAPVNPVFTKYGLPGNITIGSNSPGIHPASEKRPVHYPEWDRPSSTGYVVSNHLINEPPPGQPSFRIIVIGAGAAGIDFLHHAPRDLAGLNIEFAVYDKNPEIGGTWFENRYPGCACDNPSVGYTFPWKAKPDWTSFYSSSTEIWQYFKDIVEEENMMQYITLNTAVSGARWDNSRAKWIVKLSQRQEDGQTKEWQEECDVILNGSGFLNAWKWPDIPGLHKFKGPIFHTAHYKEGFDLKDKRVAVIGSGSSGVQVSASIYPEVQHLYTWVRSPTWITAAFGQQFAGKNGQNFEYTEEQKQAFAKDPASYQRYKKTIENELNKRFKLVLRNTKESDEANAYAFQEMSMKLAAKPYLKDFIIPQNFNVACRRPTPGNGYLEALAGEKTTVFTSSIQAITENGVVDSATGEHPVDVIICATGFDTSFRPQFPITGIDPEVTLAEKWAEFPASYLGIGVDGFPNYFTYSGPFTPVAQGSLLPIITLLTNHFIEIIKKMRRQHIRQLSPKASAVADFAEHARTFLPRTCWADPCSSWFKQGTKNGPIVMWPGSRLSFFEVLHHPNYEDYDIEYYGKNRWSFLGSGFVDFEFSGSKDLTWYLDEFSGREDWVKGVPLSQDSDEFAGVNAGAVPRTNARL
ncbi:dimethylaniline monooxygenase [Aspergillus nomiae NRRL 13137]|uniref:Dimethylaniline monooxygenase n=1 Tax=Aspergillus nomiae NRRL (strain ATCC 15546 / NRRL 13137 / CBS 260.88 / M93) TaxID=1509407 RepID=A0A0L1J322_ASPN3|nr:dimethylaniline monooxygenase [Aspergillus nomiae NRRL 13137]KNG86137.1 dimethylaniline monooxygenase [Aspergillus nomiae NRRL 13137]